MTINISGKYDYFVFDCDGVLLDSNNIKTEAFALALKDEEQSLVNRFIQYHKENGGVTRQKKFEYFYREIKKEEQKYDVETACSRFSDICQRKLNDARLIDGVETFLEKSNAKMYVVTGGNQEEVIAALEKKDILKYFIKVLGNPISKYENMQRLRESSYFKGDGLYFGDSKLDFELAEQFGQDFHLISGKSEWAGAEEFCSTRSINMSKSFLELI